MKTIGLFAGIGGIEYGLERAGFETELLCELEPAAQAVLRKRFPGCRLVSDVRALRSIPKVDVLSAGFPCQDLSQAGRTAGIKGRQSSLVGEVFRLVSSRATAPDWLLLENVSFMLRLDRGKAMHHLTSELESLGLRWAYRVVDSRSFGVPQRRQRVILLASRAHDPSSILFGDQTAHAAPTPDNPKAFGFYWTEGEKGLGWAEEAVPTLKGGSTIGIPSPPAIWFPERGTIETPGLEDAERMQGFPAGWTKPALEIAGARPGTRWKLVGNAVTSEVARWIGGCIASGGSSPVISRSALVPGASWPVAARGDRTGRFAMHATMFPKRPDHPHLSDFLRYDTKPLSRRATSGFLARARSGSLRFSPGFLAAVESHLAKAIEQDPQTRLLGVG